VLLFLGALGCSRSNDKKSQAFLDQLSHGPETELGGLIYGYKEATPGAKEVLLGLARPLRAPSPDKHMEIADSRDSGRFTILSVKMPWPKPTQAGEFQPMIICHDGGRDLLVGYVLPFDDILSRFAGPDMQDITYLSQWWIENYARH
jgi:hypothetical protein